MLWDGWCPTHDDATPTQLADARAEHPDALVLAHPECRPEVIDLADAVLSTSQMLSFAEENPAREFIVVTESGLLHGLRKAAPGKTFFELAPRMLCPNMKLTTLVKVRDCLRDGTGEVLVPEDVRIRALRAVERMVAIG
jgi:quinolinate synthase